MHALAIAAVAVGISLTASIISFAMNEMTEADKKHQKEVSDRVSRMQTDIHANTRRFRSEADLLQKQRREQAQNARREMERAYAAQEAAFGENQRRTEDYLRQRHAQAQAELQEERDRLEQKWFDENEAHVQEMAAYLLEQSQKRLDYVQCLIVELKDKLKQLNEYRNAHCTDVRRNSFMLLQQELRTILNKAYAYQTYLKEYRKNIFRICRDAQDEVIFSYTLPNNFPYQGAFVSLSEKEMARCLGKQGVGTLHFHQYIRINIYVGLEELKSQTHVFYVTGSDAKKIDGRDLRCFLLSSDEANYYLCKQHGSFTGLPARVTGYELKSGNVQLTCGARMKLLMKRQNLLNAAHHPAIGSEIIVYPLEEWYDKRLKCMVHYVTQRFEDTEIALSFHEIPILIPPKKLVPFCQYFEDHNIDQEYNDAKIAPLSNDDIQEEMLRIQFQEDFLMAVRICKRSIGKVQAVYFEFDHFLKASDQIRPEDIFASFRAVVKMYDEPELHELFHSENGKTAADEMQQLIMTVFREFRYQKELMAAGNGSRYFAAWEQLTNELKEYLTNGDSICCTVSSFPYYDKNFDDDKKIKKDIKFQYPIENQEELMSYLTKQTEEGRYTSFFIEWNGMRLDTRISQTCEYVTVTLPAIYAEDDGSIMQLMQLTELTIYKLDYCIPEQRQLSALYRFKTGNMVNSKLHAMALNPASIQPERVKHIKPVELSNPALNSDHSQYKALCGSLNEANYYMIQGPPGTGKTTVIRELIYQTLQRKPSARILIVSQANVAVDNVLRGLPKASIERGQILRMGRDEKIAEDLRDISYEHRIDSYMQRLTQKAESGDATAQEWKRLLEQSSQRNADLGNLFTRMNQIIGATCVGLSQRNIGLEDLVFDLAIVDEAGKALMPEILIPLLKTRKLVLIGDHKQLPPVVHPALYDPEKIELEDRQYFKEQIFDTSFFERQFRECPQECKTILTTQYRMPPLIGTMISELFYKGKIQNGKGTEQKLPHFFDTSISLLDMTENPRYHEVNNQNSPTNPEEANYLVKLLQRIRKKCPDDRIAVITPYKGQKRQIIETLKRSGISLEHLPIDTVDAFQGDEAEIVIFCTTRAKRKTDFFSDFRRLNVAFSRAKNELIVIASAAYLKKYDADKPIRKALEYMREHQCIRPAAEALHMPTRRSDKTYA